MVVAIKKSDLYSSLWKSCDELRGGMDASQYKDYILTLLFVKYVTDKAKTDESESSTINAAIGACGVQPGCANGTTGNPYKDILFKMTGLGALVIPAHANVPKSVEQW